MPQRRAWPASSCGGDRSERLGWHCPGRRQLLATADQVGAVSSSSDEGQDEQQQRAQGAVPPLLEGPEGAQEQGEKDADEQGALQLLMAPADLADSLRWRRKAAQWRCGT